MRQNKVKTQDMVDMYTRKHLTYEQIGKLTGMSRTAVGKRLHNAGVKAEQGTWAIRQCATCGTDVRVARSRLKITKESYCNAECYAVYLENPGYKPWRQGQRIARAIVAQYFKLEPGYIVHHEDNDNRNNDRVNLRVFASQSDHLKYHHGSLDVVPLWDGRRP